jgi:uncharacterized integral membrane protein
MIGAAALLLVALVVGLSWPNSERYLLGTPLNSIFDFPVVLVRGAHDPAMVVLIGVVVAGAMVEVAVSRARTT